MRIASNRAGLPDRGAVVLVILALPIVIVLGLYRAILDTAIGRPLCGLPGLLACMARSIRPFRAGPRAKPQSSTP
jgi:hypothetical protein